MPAARTGSVVTVNPALAACRFTYQSNGIALGPLSSSPAIAATEWLRKQGVGAGDDWEIRADFVSGDPLTAGDPANVWLALSSTRFWEVSTTSPVGVQTVLDVRIRRVGAAVDGGVTRLTLNAASEI